MEDKLVTVAIHTYERALILKGILEAEGIEAFLYNVNLIQPVISAGVRVRIKESDLPAALKLIEDLQFDEETLIEEENNAHEDIHINKTILVPIDFSGYSKKALQLASNMAWKNGCSMVLLHTYYSPFYSGGMPISDAFAFDETNDEALRAQMKRMHKSMEDLSDWLKAAFKEGDLPEVPFISKFREGVPEEQILLYAKKHKPMLIIMGTKGQGANDLDVMGTVTADVLDRSRFPVFAFPENTPFERFDEIRQIAFVTRFEQRDLVAFHSMVNLLKVFSYKIYFIHMTNEGDKWDEVQLSGIKEYFKKQYPEIESSYCVIRGDNLVDGLNDFIQERKIDVLALPAQRRNLFSRLFNPSIAHKVLFHTDTPVLVLRG